MVRVKEGMKVRYDPLSHIDGDGAREYKGTFVTGTIVMVNRAHGWFSADDGNGQRTSFNFVDIGGEVKIVG